MEAVVLRGIAARRLVEGAGKPRGVRIRAGDPELRAGGSRLAEAHFLARCPASLSTRWLRLL
ncbi:MAG: hypothetical protein DRK00_08090 [Thermoprotei archaeon]|nr:MAG: hypothetical protein DRK00_08090 [Thermoprotei archaeon]